VSRVKVGFACLLVFPLLGIAQTPDTATLRGHVIDSSHAAVAGVAIAAKNALTGLERKTVSDDSGSFTLAGLPIAGTYDVTASKAGFAEGQLKAITLVGGATADVRLQLDVAAGRTLITGSPSERATPAMRRGYSLALKAVTARSR